MHNGNHPERLSLRQESGCGVDGSTLILLIQQLGERIGKRLQTSNCDRESDRSMRPANGGLFVTTIELTTQLPIRFEKELNLDLNEAQACGERLASAYQVADPFPRIVIDDFLPKIDPVFNRCVVFNTDAQSYHGHPEPLACPPDVKRRSIALYYYTASAAIREEIPGDSTMYVPRPGEKMEARFEAFVSRMDNHLKDWLPPVVVRAIRKAKKARK